MSTINNDALAQCASYYLAQCYIKTNQDKFARNAYLTAYKDDFDNEMSEGALFICDPMDHQTLLSMGFPRQEYRSGFPFPSPGDLPDSEIKPTSLVLQADRLLPSESPGKPS